MEREARYGDVWIDGLCALARQFEEGMARMAVYHRHCQDPVIAQAPLVLTAFSR